MITENQKPPVPTNVITGFLGVGKTSAISHLLSKKPTNERWAILVNEFGEIGIDGSLFIGQSSLSDNVFIKEVPGGCMCCASGLPMQIALNLLIAEAKPDRLLIEPTGLGHPIEVMQLLSNDYYQTLIDIQQTVTMVDARNLQDRQFTEHKTFNQQLAIADVIVANKTDLYSDQESELLTKYLDERFAKSTKVYFTQHGQLDFMWLKGASNYLNSPSQHHHHHQEKRVLASEQPIPDAGLIKAVNQGEGYQSVGWRFAPEKIFDRQKLLHFLLSIDAIRVKAVFITSTGIFGYNNTSDGLNEIELDECTESRMEIICQQTQDTWESDLLSALEA
ncbi:GTP-binding protein [Endozoicomonas sp. G2_1]|uniref:CobW family GTP-binding protein n=1 Tax=Endozoicomonas sp. G2_1 TaxID=2821091 RepID=UPI001ADAA7C2|nr:GTP-binding protein [Endozoicomonas sp. G2_1]